MALLQDSTGYYLEPSTGQYYQSYQRPAYNYSPLGFWGMQSTRPADPEGMISIGSNYYVPFTGDAAGISQGKRSVVDALMKARQPYQYNVPSIAQLFPSMAMPTFNAQPTEYNAGAGKFLGGLLGNSGAAQFLNASPTTSSGAGRFA